MGRWGDLRKPARPGLEPSPPVAGGEELSPALAVPASAAAAPGTAASGAHPPAAAVPGAPAPGTARRRRRIWAALFAIVVVAGLAGGLAIWAPWQSPPLLRPTGLVAGPSTTSSVAFRWSGPASGPEPDKYVILKEGAVIGSVPGTVTSYRSTGLYPGTPYEYQVAAVRGGKRSAPSALVVLKTSAPPVSAARWEGPWNVSVRIVRGGAALRGPRPLRWNESWQVSPECAAGPCAVRLSGTFNGYRFKATLHRAGAVYTGTTVANSFRCGPRSSSVPTRTTLKIRAILTAAQGDSGAWAASSWAGTLRASAAYTSSATFYCHAFQVTASLSGNQ